MKAVIFDMDGVLIDSEPIYQEANEELFIRLGISLGYDEYASYVGTNTEFMWTQLKNKYNLPQPLEELMEVSKSVRLEALQTLPRLEPVDGVVDFLKLLKTNGYKMAVASSSPKNQIELVTKRLSIGDFFDALVSGDEVKRSKPAPDIFLRAAEILEIAPKDCIVVEDSSNGVIAAKSCHMKCIGYANPSSFTQDLKMADIIIKNFRELISEDLSSYLFK